MGGCSGIIRTADIDGVELEFVVLSFNDVR